MKFDKNMLFSKYNEFIDSKKKLEELMSKAKHDTDIVIEKLDSLISYINDHDEYDIDFIYDSIVSIKHFIEDH